MESCQSAPPDKPATTKPRPAAPDGALVRGQLSFNMRALDWINFLPERQFVLASKRTKSPIHDYSIAALVFLHGAKRLGRVPKQKV